MKTFATAWTTLVLVTLAGCAAQQQATGGPRSPNQVKQQELKAMEAQGQRNDFDKVRVD